MTIYNFYIFDRAGQCLVFRNWTHNTASTSTSSSSSSSSSSAASQAAVRKIESRKKLVFGLLHSMKAFCKTISPVRLDEFENEPFSSFSTSDYKLHYFETPTGLRFAMTTDPKVGNVTDTLRRIYLLFVELVVRNPSHVPGTSPINVPSFALKLEALITGLPWFA